MWCIVLISYMCLLVEVLSGSNKMNAKLGNQWYSTSELRRLRESQKTNVRPLRICNRECELESILDSPAAHHSFAETLFQWTCLLPPACVSQSLRSDQSVTCVWQGHAASSLRRARQVWLRAEEQPEEEALRDPGPQVGQKGHHLLVSRRHHARSKSELNFLLY